MQKELIEGKMMTEGTKVGVCFIPMKIISAKDTVIGVGEALIANITKQSLTKSSKKGK